MKTYVIRRLMQAVIILILVSFLVFIVMRLLPGDPITIYIGQATMDSAGEEQIEALRREFGLDKPILAQYIHWATDVLSGDLGTSITYGEDVSAMIARSLPITVYLGTMAFIISAFIGILSGVICAVRRGRFIDSVITLLANFGITVPSFWLGILMIYLFGLKLGWLPIFGYTSAFDDFWLSTKQLIMPVFCLAVFPIGSLARQTRSSMLEVIRQDYIRTALAKGLRERTLIVRHALKNALVPVITLIGVQVRSIFGGSVLIETVFNIPGMGRLAIMAIFDQDYAIVQGVCLIIGCVVTLSSLAVDISYGWLNPKIRYS